MEPTKPLPVPPLTDEQRAATLPEMKALRDDVRRKLRGMGVRAGDAVSGYLRVAALLDEGDQLQAAHEALIAEADSLRSRLSEAEAAVEAGERERAGLQDKLAASDLVIVALKEHNQRVLAAALAPPFSYDEAEKLAAGPACQRDCQTCEKKAGFFPCVACGAKSAPECLGDTCQYSTSVLPQPVPAGGAGAGLQGEPAEVFRHRKEHYLVNVEKRANHRPGYMPSNTQYVWFRRQVGTGKRIVTPLTVRKAELFAKDFEAVTVATKPAGGLQGEAGKGGQGE